MSNSEIRYLGDVQRLEIKPGDMLVLSIPGSATNETVARIRAEFESCTGYKLIVIFDGAKLGVIGAA